MPARRIRVLRCTLHIYEVADMLEHALLLNNKRGEGLTRSFRLAGAVFKVFGLLSYHHPKNPNTPKTQNKCHKPAKCSPWGAAARQPTQLHLTAHSARRRQTPHAPPGHCRPEFRPLLQALHFSPIHMVCRMA